MTTLLIVVHVIVCFFLIAIVLLQHGKGADIGATFGGSSQSLFGTEGPVPLLHKITTGAAIIFMLTSVTLAYYSANKSTGSVMSKVPVQEQTVPASQEATPAAAQPAAPVSVPATASEKAAEEARTQATEEAAPAKAQQSAPAGSDEKAQSAVPESQQTAPAASPAPLEPAKKASAKKQAETAVAAEKPAKETSKPVKKVAPAPRQKVEIQKGADKQKQ